MIDQLRRVGHGPLLLRTDPAGAAAALGWAECMADNAARAPTGVPVAMAGDALADGWRPYDMAGPVAVIPVMGLITPSFPFIGCRWATGCEELRWQIDTALRDDQVRGIALMVDSGGGYVAGVDETVAAIRAAGERKPVAAVVEHWCFSAAYWLASAAQTISAPRMGGVGHVGVIQLHLDFSEMLKAEGVRPTLIHAGARKADGHPFVQLADQARADMQSAVDAIRQVFAESVAEARGLPLDAVLGTEARAFDGPAAIEEARQLGLVDAILPAEEALAAFASAFTTPQQ